MANRVRSLVLLTTALLLVGVGVAYAHIEPSVAEAPAGTALDFTLKVEHGCDPHAATIQLDIQIPSRVTDVKGGTLAGWTSSFAGAVLTFKGGPLPHDTELEFPLSVKLPNTPGATLNFPIIQTCEGGAHTDWIEITPAGGPEPDHPAAQIKLTGSDATTTTTTNAPSSTTTVLSPATGDSSSSNNGPWIVGLVVLAIVIAGGATIVMRRRA